METYRSPVIGEAAPHFQAETTYGKVNFPEDYKGKWVIVFSYYGDFSPVCATEMMELASNAGEFAANGCSLLGLSVDSAASHVQWTRAMERYRWGNAGARKVSFPLIADDHGEVSRLYGILPASSVPGRTARHVFYIDPHGVLRAMLSYPVVVGRNTHEMLRLLLALQTVDATGYYTPGNWVPGNDLVYSAPQTTMGAQKLVEELKGSGCIDWYLCYAKDSSRAPMAAKGGPRMAPITAEPSASPATGKMNEPPSSDPPTGSATVLAVQMPQIPQMPPMPGQTPLPDTPQMPPMPGQMPRPDAPQIPPMPGQMPRPEAPQMPPMPGQMPRPEAPQMPENPEERVPQQPPRRNPPPNKMFTNAELAKFNGRNNMPPYGAVNGIVYDLTPIMNTPAHMALKPGTDMTRDFMTCHMGMTYLLNRVTPVGTLTAQPTPAPAPVPPAGIPELIDSAHDYIILRDFPSQTPSA